MTPFHIELEVSVDQTTVTFLGTSSVVPEAGRDTASFVINRKYLIDTGWCAATKMLAVGLSPLDMEWLFITHCHHDHYIGLPHILFYLRMRKRDRPDRAPLKIAGPEDNIEEVVELARRFLQVDRFPEVDCAPEVHPIAPGGSLETDAFRIDTCQTKHAVQGLCYRFADKVTGATVAFTGDTGYHPPVAEHVRGCGLLIHEASHGATSPEPRPGQGHAGAPDAARIARAAGVKQLALVHGTEPNIADALAAARQIFPDTIWPDDGQVVTVAGAGAGQ